MGETLYYDDLEPGRQFTSGAVTMGKEDVLGFAREYDPQYFHLDEETAKESIFGRLVVSGWHTAAVTMRLKAQSPLGKMAGGLIGLGIDAMHWPRPVYPGDTLRIVITILEKRPSRSKPTHGVVKYKVETLNQKDELVMEMTTAVLAPRLT